MLTTREAIALKIESTSRTENAPNATTDAILVSAMDVTNHNLTMVERPNIKPSLATDKSIFAGMMKKITFTAEIKGSGTAGTAPEIGQALRACGLSETITANTSVVYEPVSEDHETCTIYYYQDGILEKIIGAIGTVTFNAEGKGLGTAQFEFTGHYGGRANASFPSLSYDSTVPVPFMNLAFSIDSFGAVINSFNLALTNTIVTPGDVSDEYGFGDVRITKRDPNGTIDPEATLLTVKDFEQKLRSGSEMTLTTGNVGSAAGNIWKLDANVVIRDISYGEREQIRTNDLTFGCHEQTGDDEFTLTFL